MGAATCPSVAGPGPKGAVLQIRASAAALCVAAVDDAEAVPSVHIIVNRPPRWASVIAPSNNLVPNPGNLRLALVPTRVGPWARGDCAQKGSYSQ